jgi:hypothetical protein
MVIEVVEVIVTTHEEARKFAVDDGTAPEEP